MDFADDKHLDVLQNIESGLKNQYEKNSHLSDLKTIYALDHAKIAIKQEFGFAKNEKVVIDDTTKGIVEWCVSLGKERIGKINDLTLKEYLDRIEKVKQSVKLHSDFGRRGYYEFIREFV